MGCLVQVGNGIEPDTVGRQFEPYRWRPCGVTWILWILFPNSRGNKAGRGAALRGSESYTHDSDWRGGPESHTHTHTRLVPPAPVTMSGGRAPEAAGHGAG